MPVVHVKTPMPDISSIPFGTPIESVVRGVLVNKPELGGVGAMEIDGYPGWYRRIDEVETITEVVNDQRALAARGIDGRVLAALPLLAAGLPTAEIAEKLAMNTDTFKTALRKSMNAWGARNRVNFVSMAYRFGVLEVHGAS